MTNYAYLHWKTKHPVGVFSSRENAQAAFEADAPENITGGNTVEIVSTHSSGWVEIIDTTKHFKRRTLEDEVREAFDDSAMDDGTNDVAHTYTVGTIVYWLIAGPFLAIRALPTVFLFVFYLMLVVVGAWFVLVMLGQL